MFELQAIVEVPEPGMLLGVIVPHISPLGIVSVSETVPPNPLSAAIVMEVVPFDPAFAVNVAVELIA